MLISLYSLKYSLKKQALLVLISTVFFHTITVPVVYANDWDDLPSASEIWEGLKEVGHAVKEGAVEAGHNIAIASKEGAEAASEAWTHTKGVYRSTSTPFKVGLWLGLGSFATMVGSAGFTIRLNKKLNEKYKELDNAQYNKAITPQELAQMKNDLEKLKKLVALVNNGQKVLSVVFLASLAGTAWHGAKSGRGIAAYADLEMGYDKKDVGERVEFIDSRCELFTEANPLYGTPGEPARIFLRSGRGELFDIDAAMKIIENPAEHAQSITEKFHEETGISKQSKLVKPVILGNEVSNRWQVKANSILYLESVLTMYRSLLKNVDFVFQDKREDAVLEKRKVSLVTTAYYFGVPGPKDVTGKARFVSSWNQAAIDSLQPGEIIIIDRYKTAMGVIAKAKKLGGIIVVQDQSLEVHRRDLATGHITYLRDHLAAHPPAIPVLMGCPEAKKKIQEGQEINIGSYRGMQGWVYDTEPVTKRTLKKLIQECIQAVENEIKEMNEILKK